MRFGTWVRIGAAFALAMTVALIAVFKSIDFATYRPVLAAGLARAGGASVTLDGPVTLHLGLSPSLTLQGLVWERGDLRLAVPRIQADVALIPLLSREIVLRAVTLNGPVLSVGADGAGHRADGAFALGLRGMVAGSGRAVPPTRLDLREVTIENGLIRGTAAGDIRLNTANLQPNGPDDRLTLQAEGEWRGQTFRIGGLVGALDLKPWPVRVKATLPGALATLDGVLADPMTLGGSDLDLRMQGEELGRILGLTGLLAEPGLIGPFKITAHIGERHGRICLERIDAAAGRPESVVLSAKGEIIDPRRLGGLSLAVQAEGEAPEDLLQRLGFPIPLNAPMHLGAHLSGDRTQLRLADLKGRVAAADIGGDLTLSTNKIGGHLSVSDLGLADLTGEPAAQALRAADADFSVSIGRLDLGALVVTDGAAQIRANRGRFEANGITGRVGTGGIAGDLRLALPSPHGASADIHATLTGLLPNGPIRLTVAGTADDLTSLPGRLSGDITGSGTGSDGRAPRCTVLRGKIADGIATARLAVETPAGGWLGEGQWSLSDGRLDGTVGPYHVGGTANDPVVEIAAPPPTPVRHACSVLSAHRP